MNTHFEAMILAMLLVSASDRDIHDYELIHIGRLARELPAFAGFNPDELTAIAQNVGAILGSSNGMEKGLAIVEDGVPDELRETAYLLACEVAIVDRMLPLEELRVLQLLRQRLRIDRLTAVALERSTTARWTAARNVMPVAQLASA